MKYALDHFDYYPKNAYYLHPLGSFATEDIIYSRKYAT